MSDQDNTQTPEAPPKTTPLQTRPETTAHDRLNKTRLGYTWQNFFKDKKDGDIWVQNLSDMQISLDIEIGPGQTQGRLVPPTPDPLCLTEEFPFEVLKKSSNFRKTINKRRNHRAILILLDEDQVEAYYKAKARQMGAVDASGDPDVMIAMDAAEKRRMELTTRQQEGDEVNASNLYGFKPPKSAQELIAMDLANRGIAQGDQGFMSQRAQAGMPSNMMHQGGIQMTEIVNPKVLHLCRQVSPEIPENMRMPARQFYEALQSMQNTLTLDDYQHIEAHGTFRTVKAWARQQIARTASGDDGIPDNLSLAGQAQVGQAQQRGAIENVVPIPQGMGPQGPAALDQHGMGYAGPQGFANAPFKEMHGAAEPAGGVIMGPDGTPLG